MSPRYDPGRKSLQSKFKLEQKATTTRVSPRLIRLKLPQVERSIPVPTLKLVNLKLKNDVSKTQQTPFKKLLKPAERESKLS